MLEKSAFSIGELAKAGPISRSKIYEAIRDGELVARKHGRSTIILKSEWEEFLASLPTVRHAVPTHGPSSRAVA